MQQQQIDSFKTELNKWQTWFSRGTKQWGFAYHFCLYGTVILTLLVGFLTQIGVDAFYSDKKFIAALSFLATLFSTLIAKGGFDRKWRINRINKGKIDNLNLDLLEDNADYKKALDELKKIITEHNLVIIGENVELKEDNVKEIKNNK